LRYHLGAAKNFLEMTIAGKVSAFPFAKWNYRIVQDFFAVVR
jgi:hypothetical protein